VACQALSDACDAAAVGLPPAALAAYEERRAAGRALLRRRGSTKPPSLRRRAADAIWEHNRALAGGGLAVAIAVVVGKLAVKRREGAGNARG
jgi:hypothetical protein